MAVAPTAVYVAGGTEGQLPGETHWGWDDIYVRAYDHWGNEVWTDQLGAASYDIVGNVAATGDAAYVVGTIVDGDALPGQASAGADDAFIRKYDATGNEVWTRQFGTSSWERATGVAVTATSVLVAGNSDALFIRSYDFDGNFLWETNFSSSGVEEITSLAATETGIYATGYTSGEFSGQTSAGGYDVFVARFDLAGNLVWLDQFGSASIETATDVAAADGGVFISGRTEGALPGQTLTGSYDAFVRAYDHSGAALWTRQFGTIVASTANGVAATADTVFIGGASYGALSGQTDPEGWDAFLQRYDLGGTLLATRQFGTPPGGAGSLATADSMLYVTGVAGVRLPGEPTGIQGGAFVMRTRPDFGSGH